MRFHELAGHWLKSLALLTCCLLSIEGCIDLDEKVRSCAADSLAESVHAWGREIDIRPAAGQEWFDLIREPFRGYGYPPVNQQTLEQRFGVPDRAWNVENRPFVEYRKPEGRLQLGLEEDRSGSDSYRSWRLRLTPHKMDLAAVLEKSVTACLEQFELSDVEVVVLSRSDGLPKLVLTVRGRELREVVWPNLGAT